MALGLCLWTPCTPRPRKDIVCKSRLAIDGAARYFRDLFHHSGGGEATPSPNPRDVRRADNNDSTTRVHTHVHSQRLTPHSAFTAQQDAATFPLEPLAFLSHLPLLLSLNPLSALHTCSDSRYSEVKVVAQMPPRTSSKGKNTSGTVPRPSASASAASALSHRPSLSKAGSGAETDSPRASLRDTRPRISVEVKTLRSPSTPPRRGSTQPRSSGRSEDDTEGEEQRFSNVGERLTAVRASHSPMRLSETMPAGGRRRSHSPLSASVEAQNGSNYDDAVGNERGDNSVISASAVRRSGAVSPRKSQTVHHSRATAREQGMHDSDNDNELLERPLRRRRHSHAGRQYHSVAQRQGQQQPLSKTAARSGGSGRKGQSPRLPLRDPSSHSPSSSSSSSTPERNGNVSVTNVEAVGRPHRPQQRSPAAAPQVVFFHHYESMRPILIRVGVVPLPGQEVHSTSRSRSPSHKRSRSASPLSPDVECSSLESSAQQQGGLRLPSGVAPAASAAGAGGSPFEATDPQAAMLNAHAVNYVERFLPPRRFFQLGQGDARGAGGSVGATKREEVVGWAGVFTGIPLVLPGAEPPRAKDGHSGPGGFLAALKAMVPTSAVGPTGGWQDSAQMEVDAAGSITVVLSPNG